MNTGVTKRKFLRFFVIAMALSALIGIAVFLLGDFRKTEIQLLWTTVAVCVFCLTALCNSITYYKENLKIFSLVGMLISLIALMISVFVIWEFAVFENTWKIMTVMAILAITMGQLSLVLIFRPKTAYMKIAKRALLIITIIVSAMFIKSTLSGFGEPSFYYRWLGVFVVLMVFGTVALPILNLASKRKNLS